MDTPFHPGEVAVQARIGMAERMAEIGSRVVRNHLPEQHQRFYEQLPFMLAGSVDPAGRPWATLLVGRPGFVHAPDDRHLDFAATPIPGDPAAAGLVAGAPLGLLGIELHTRRRNRVNGQLQAAGPQGLRLRVQQTVGNCPQYIQGREVDWVRDAADTRPRAIERVADLAGDAAWLIASADTLFVASHAGDASDAGADVSHRGGPAGFVVQEDERTLLVPDYAGNRMFMTLGNLQADGRAGLLFIDFERGDLLTLTGRADIVWDGPLPDGAERAWRFHLDEAWWLRDALPLRWRFRDWAPQNRMVGADGG